MSEKFVVKVIRHRITETPAPKESSSQTPTKKEEIDSIYEQEFDHLNIGELAVILNKKDGQQKDLNSIKV
jgi:hypothetical protein